MNTIEVELSPREIKLLIKALGAKRPASPMLENETLDLVRKLAQANAEAEL